MTQTQRRYITNTVFLSPIAVVLLQKHQLLFTLTSLLGFITSRLHHFVSVSAWVNNIVFLYQPVLALIKAPLFIYFVQHDVVTWCCNLCITCANIYAIMVINFLIWNINWKHVYISAMLILSATILKLLAGMRVCFVSHPLVSFPSVSFIIKSRQLAGLAR